MATSFRRAARSCPAATCLSSRHSTPSISASTAASFKTRGHQRRHSSSKPPVPPNHGSSNLPAASQGSVKTVTSKPKAVSDKRAGAESRLSKRKTKDQSVAGTPSKAGVPLNIPMVPPTQHLQPRGAFPWKTLFALLAKICFRCSPSFFVLYTPSYLNPLVHTKEHCGRKLCLYIRPQNQKESERAFRRDIHLILCGQSS